MNHMLAPPPAMRYSPLAASYSTEPGLRTLPMSAWLEKIPRLDDWARIKEVFIRRQEKSADTGFHGWMRLMELIKAKAAKLESLFLRLEEDKFAAGGTTACSLRWVRFSSKTKLVMAAECAFPLV